MDERKKCGVATAERRAHRSAAWSTFQHLRLHFREAFLLRCCHFLCHSCTFPFLFCLQTPFADLVSFPCSSHVKNKLFFQMFSGILFALWLLSLIIFFYRQFSSCSCSDFASQALPFFFLTPAVVSCLLVPIMQFFLQMFGFRVTGQPFSPAPLATNNGWRLFRKQRVWIRFSHTL